MYLSISDPFFGVGFIETHIHDLHNLDIIEKHIDYIDMLTVTNNLLVLINTRIDIFNTNAYINNEKAVDECEMSEDYLALLSKYLLSAILYFRKLQTLPPSPTNNTHYNRVYVIIQAILMFYTLKYRSSGNKNVRQLLIASLLPGMRAYSDNLRPQEVFRVSKGLLELVEDIDNTSYDGFYSYGTGDFVLPINKDTVETINNIDDKIRQLIAYVDEPLLSTVIFDYGTVYDQDDIVMLVEMMFNDFNITVTNDLVGRMVIHISRVLYDAYIRGCNNESRNHLGTT